MVDENGKHIWHKDRDSWNFDSSVKNPVFLNATRLFDFLTGFQIVYRIHNSHQRAILWPTTDKQKIQTYHILNIEATDIHNARIAF